MSDPLRAYVAVALAVGTVVGAGTVIALEATVFKPAPRVVPDRAAAPVAAEPNDEDALEAANASLVTSLAECNRRLREAGQRPQPTPPAPVASVMADDGDRASRRGRRERAPLTKEDWERHAEAGTVPYRIPCLRDTPFKPSERDLERLGLTPDDAQAITEAYAASNKRMTDQITPLCASVVGSTDVAQKLGPQACLKALQDSARRADPAKMKESLTHVAEVNAGKREATKGDGSTTEKLFLSLTGEQKAFEDDLAKRLGPEDAARIVASRGLCQERGTASASEDGPPRGSGGGGRGRRGAPEN
jgi:hypothetical protein